MAVFIKDMINFVIVNSVLSSLIYSNIANEIGNREVDGSISTDFIKLMNLFRFNHFLDEYFFLY